MVIVAGVCSGDSFDFDGLLERENSIIRVAV